MVDLPERPVSHFGSTWLRMTEASRAVVVAWTFHVAIHWRAWSPNSTRPACGET
jgi:hypothetical protein